MGQLCSTASVSANLAQCRTLVRKAVEAGAKVSCMLLFVTYALCLTKSAIQALFLPEAADYIASSPAESVSLARPVQDNEFVLGLQSEARNGDLHINVGIHEPASDGRVKNTLIWIDNKGEITQRYQKVHLFDVDIKGGPVLKESS